MSEDDLRYIFQDMSGDPYSGWLKKLNELDDDSFESTNRIGTREREYVQRLLKSIDGRIIKRFPAKKNIPERFIVVEPDGREREETKIPDNYPRYVLMADRQNAIIRRGGEAVILPCRDQMRNNREVVLRIALPKIAPKQKKPLAPATPQPIVRRPTRRLEPPKERKIGQGIKDLWEFVRSTQDERDAKKQAEEQSQLQEILNTEHSLRFSRGCRIQRECNTIMKQKGLQRYGYIPEIYSVVEPTGDHHRQYCVMEYSPAQPLLDWVQDKEDIEILTMYYSIVLFIEQCLHCYTYIHSDLKHSNIGVLENNLPVLFDFGYAKKLGEVALTNEGMALGSALFCEESQFMRSRQRSFPQDIYMLATVLWCMWARCEPGETADMRDENGWPVFSVIRESFNADVFPLNLRYIFNKAFSTDAIERYQDISKLRNDIAEAIKEFRGAQQQQICQQPCEELRALLERESRRVQKLRDLLGDKLEE